MLCGALDRAANTPNGPKFVIKGGVALELRLPGRARATNDLDLVAMCADHDLVATLDEALRAPYFNDAVDLLLLKDRLASEELTSVRRACEDTFRIRAEHAWPPEVVLPKHWRDPFKSMAQSVGLSITSIDDAESGLRALLDSIVNAASN